MLSFAGTISACAELISRFWNTMRSISASAGNGGAVPSISMVTSLTAGSWFRRLAVVVTSGLYVIYREHWAVRAA